MCPRTPRYPLWIGIPQRYAPGITSSITWQNYITRRCSCKATDSPKRRLVLVQRYYAGDWWTSVGRGWWDDYVSGRSFARPAVRRKTACWSCVFCCGWGRASATRVTRWTHDGQYVESCCVLTTTTPGWPVVLVLPTQSSKRNTIQYNRKERSWICIL